MAEQRGETAQADRATEPDETQVDAQVDAQVEAQVETQASPPVRIVVDKDRLRAWVEPEKDVLLSEVTVPAIEAELEKAKVAPGDAVLERINDLVEKISEEGALPERFLIAEGEAPQPPQDGYFVMAEGEQEQEATEDDSDGEEGEEDDGARVDYRSRNFIPTVEADTVIGKLVPPTPGVSGMDVHGNELRPRGTGRPVQLLDNVRLSEDGETVWSTAAGLVVYQKGQLRVDDVLEIKGDVDFESGNIDATSDVHIRGTVRDLFKVASKKSIMVDGAIEAAFLRAQNNLLVRGGVLGRSKGRVVVAGEVAARFCVEADIRAGGEVRIDKEVINSRVNTDGRLYVEHGVIIGGEIYARRGIVARALGSEAGVFTALRVGLPLKILWQARQIEEANRKRQEVIEHIRQVVQPLMNNVKRMSTAQKERATELLFQAESMEAEVQEAQSKLEALLNEDGAPEDAFVRVQKLLCQGVVIFIGDRATEIKADLKGPVQIELREIDEATEFAAVDQVSGNVVKLPGERIKIEKPPEEEEEEQAEQQEEPED